MADYGHKATDEMLAEMEKKVARTYEQALADMQKKLNDFLGQYQAADKKKSELVAAGKLSQRDYIAWRQQSIMLARNYSDMIKVLAQDCTNASKIAAKIINGELPSVYALNANFTAFEVEELFKINLSWSLYSRETVERLLRDNPDILPIKPEIDVPEDLRWNHDHIRQEITQGILQGEPIPKIAKRLKSVADMSTNAAIRNARTATTAAECAGRMDVYKKANDMGIKIKQRWVSTLDGRTRHAHRLLDGQTVDIGKPFTVDGYEIEYPGDPKAPGYLIYNCRCTVVSVDKFHDDTAERASKLGESSYQEWKAGKEIEESKSWGTYTPNSGQIQKTIDNVDGSATISKEEKFSESGFKSFSDGNETNDFFYFDDDKRGLLAKTNSQYGKWLNNLEDGTRPVIADYCADAYDDINKYWRQVGDWQNIDADKVKYQTDLIDKAIASFNLKDSIQTYRGVDLDTIIQLFPDAEELSDLVGQTFSDKAFSSTSPVRSVAEKFASQNGQDGVLLQLFVPSGTGRGAYINKLSGFQNDEYEFLLKRNAKFEVIDVDTSGGMPVVKGRWIE